MNYLIIQTPDQDLAAPHTVSEVFTDEELLAIGTFLETIENEHSDDLSEAGTEAIIHFINLLQKWEIETQ